MSAKTIYTQLVQAGMSPTGAFAMMGNMQAESAMRANNAQDGMTKKTDAEYTAAVDNGTYPYFVNDAVGYGLCQWTYHTRKAELLSFAKSRGVSIGDESMQVAFAIKELKRDYAKLWKYLTTTTDLQKATSRICKEFERPAVNNITTRYKNAIGFRESLANVSETKPNEAETYWSPRTLCKGMSGADVSVLQAVLLARGYKVNITGTFDDLTETAVETFQTDKGLVVDRIVGDKTWAELLKRE